MARILLRWMALCWFVLIAVQCGSRGNESVEILVRVRNLPTDVAVLSVSAVLNGRRAMSGVEFTQQLSQFTVTLPIDASSEGALELDVNALTPDRCRTASVRLDLTVALAHPYTEVEVGLVQLPAKLCTLTVEKIGNGSVTIAPPGINCGNTCQVELPYGTQVKLSTQRGPEWFVTDWGSMCNGAQYGPAGACDVPLTAPTGLVVKLSDGSCSTSGWCSSNSAPQGNSLFRVWGKDAANVWAVGSRGTILKWNGSAWSSQSSGTSQSLWSVWGSDTSNTWMVGDRGTILKWNGSAWSSQSSGTSQSLLSVWGSDASNIWAVGDGGTILKWNGSAWSSQPSGTSQSLLSVWGSGASNIWAVGSHGTILKWNGSAWSSQSIDTSQSFWSVWGSDASNIWVVGDGGTILKWNGSAWSSQSSGTSQSLLSVWGSNASNIWAVGSYGTIVRWNGSAWSSQSSGTSQYLLSVWGSDPSNIWAVGSGGILLHWSQS